MQNPYSHIKVSGCQSALWYAETCNYHISNETYNVTYLSQIFDQQVYEINLSLNSAGCSHGINTGHFKGRMAYNTD